MKIAVLGAGAWGTALAINASRNLPTSTSSHEVTLWARDAAQAAAMQAQRENTRYLPDVALPERLLLSTGAAALKTLTKTADLLVLAAPMAALRGLLTSLQDTSAKVVWLCKGFEAAQAGRLGLLAHEVQMQVAPTLQAGVLSGPSFALEVARGQPTALVAVSEHAEVRAALVAAFHNHTLRVYENDDIVGVEVGGAVKNVLAIATGLCDGLDLGFNARAALITRGLTEMMRLGLALGAKAETFMGLSGLGDLVLTATGDLSRNRQVGLALSRGLTLAQAVASLGHVAEGVYCARTVVQRAHQLGVDMPIAQAVQAVLDGQLQPQKAVQQLMRREPTAETDDPEPLPE